MRYINFTHRIHVSLDLVTLKTQHLDRVKRIRYLSPMRAAKVQASLRIRAVSPEPSLLARTSSESRGTFRQKTRSLVPLNGWACAVKICHDGMLEDTNSLDGAHFMSTVSFIGLTWYCFRCNILYCYMTVENPISWLVQFTWRGAWWLSGRVSDSGARGRGFDTYRRRVVSLSKTLYSPKVLVNYPGSGGSVPTGLKNCWLGR